MGKKAPTIKTSTNVISLEDERKARLRKLLRELAKASGRLVLQGYDRNWHPTRKFRLSRAAAGLFWKLIEMRGGGVHSAHATVFDLRELEASGIIVIEEDERLYLGGDNAGYEVIEGETPARFLKHRKR